MPPPLFALLPDKVLFVTIRVPMLKMPPPLFVAMLPEKVLFVTVTVTPLFCSISPPPHLEVKAPQSVV